MARAGRRRGVLEHARGGERLEVEALELVHRPSADSTAT
jgi:hypothetical protein